MVSMMPLCRYETRNSKTRRKTLRLAVLRIAFVSPLFCLHTGAAHTMLYSQGQAFRIHDVIFFSSSSVVEIVVEFDPDLS